MPNATAIYCRISDDRGGLRAGVERQEEDCREVARHRGWPVAEVYVDNDISAYNGKRRPEYERMLGDLEAGRVDAIVAHHPDRLYRRIKDLDRLMTVVQNAGAVVATVKVGDVKMDTADDRLVTGLLGQLAQHEAERISERVKRAHRQKAERGDWKGGGPRAFGYDRQHRHQVPEEAKLVREAAQHVLSRGTLSSLAKTWNARGLRGATGRPWSPTAIKSFLVSPRIAGLREHRGQVTKATWRPIITPADHERLVAILNDPGRRTNDGKNARKYLLTAGLAQCGLCGHPLVARPDRDGKRNYACLTQKGGCGGILALAKPVEDKVRVDVIARAVAGGLAKVQRAASSDDAGARAAAEELETLGARRQEFADLAASGELGPRDFANVVRGIDVRAEELRGQLRAARGATLADQLPSDAAGLDAWWESADLSLRIEFLGLFVERVDIVRPTRKGPRFDPDRVQVVWRR